MVERLDVLDPDDADEGAAGEDNEDDEPVAGPISIAVDLNETDAQAADVTLATAVPSP